MFNVSVGWKENKADGLKQVCVSVCVRSAMTINRIILCTKLLSCSLPADEHSVHGLPEQILQRQ